MPLKELGIAEPPSPTDTVVECRTFDYGATGAAAVLRAAADAGAFDAAVEKIAATGRRPAHFFRLEGFLSAIYNFASTADALYAVRLVREQLLQSHVAADRRAQADDIGQQSDLEDIDIRGRVSDISAASDESAESVSSKVSALTSHSTSAEAPDAAELPSVELPDKSAVHMQRLACTLFSAGFTDETIASITHRVAVGRLYPIPTYVNWLLDRFEEHEPFAGMGFVPAAAAALELRLQQQSGGLHKFTRQRAARQFVKSVCYPLSADQQSAIEALPVGQVIAAGAAGGALPQNAKILKVNLKPSDDEDAVVEALEVLKQSLGQNFEIFYHGTDGSSAISIVKDGIALDKCTSSGDFGVAHCFYISPHVWQAVEHAKMRFSAAEGRMLIVFAVPPGCIDEAAGGAEFCRRFMLPEDRAELDELVIGSWKDNRRRVKNFDKFALIRGPVPVNPDEIFEGKLPVYNTSLEQLAVRHDALADHMSDWVVALVFVAFRP